MWSKTLSADSIKVFSVETGKLAVLCHAAIYIFGSPLDTGNFVPMGQIAPEKVPIYRV
jgi:hypothetical protein